jgi:hypothetical protein
MNVKPFLSALALLSGLTCSAHADSRLVTDHHKIPSYFIGEWCGETYSRESDIYMWQLPSVTECIHTDIISVSDGSFYLNGVDYQVTWVNEIPEDCAPSGCMSQIHIATSQNRVFEMSRYKHNLYLKQISARPSPPPPPMASNRFPEAPACFAASDDGVVNVRETPNGVLIGPIPSGTPLTVLGTYPTNRQWSRIQTPWLARAGRVGVVATDLIQCN